ncbi:FAD-binding protein [Paenibacillus albicereus]|uniref:FAD-binding protein n=1 Tax=Paenibacillus albicereus TaxID=2726185 RepID=A0A6H2GUI0_9BACL|nr:D-arabinono-1,4-lactone oxidase [Paenibacillus albicereus]QJC51081.1 FAD-binding protein [Paenibacillus albicereus]
MSARFEAGRWTNWAGNVVAEPAEVVYPASVEETAEAVRRCRREGRKLRVVGSGHSFTPIAASDGMMLSLDRMQGLIELDEEAGTALVWGGTKLRRLGRLLHERGWAQENLGDIDVQSIAGAIATGTHGTGRGFGNISTQAVELTVVTGAGDIVTCSESSHSDWFKALQVSAGMLGVIVQVRLRLQRAFRMEYSSSTLPLGDCLGRLDELADGNRHFEFFWFPYAEPCQIKRMNPTERPSVERPVRDYISDVLVENKLFGLLSEGCRLFPSLAPRISRLSASSVPVGTKVSDSYRLFATERSVKFVEMEYNVPAEAMAPVIREMRAEMERQRYRVHFPVECRYAKGDDIPLSPAYGRDSAYIAVHMYKGMPHEAYFAAMERIFLAHGGRPHWGKLHSLGAAQLRGLYPRWDSFAAARRELDPDGVFLSGPMARLFGETPPAGGADRSASGPDGGEAGDAGAGEARIG